MVNDRCYIPFMCVICAQSAPTSTVIYCVSSQHKMCVVRISQTYWWFREVLFVPNIIVINKHIENFTWTCYIPICGQRHFLFCCICNTTYDRFTQLQITYEHRISVWTCQAFYGQNQYTNLMLSLLLWQLFMQIVSLIYFRQLLSFMTINLVKSLEFLFYNVLSVSFACSFIIYFYGCQKCWIKVNIYIFPKID